MRSEAYECPSCGDPGSKVKQTTLDHLVDAEGFEKLVHPRFCATGSCDVVYFDGSGTVIPKRALRVAVFQKGSSPSRPVCYCFNHSVAEVIAAGRAGRPNSIVEAITDACRRGLDRCEETNPQGRCCLANVRRVAKATGACCSGTLEA